MKLFKMIVVYLGLFCLPIWMGLAQETTEASPTIVDASIPSIENLPLKDSLQDKINQLKEGDTLIIEDGIYTGPLKISASGSKQAPIVVRARNRGKAVIRGDSKVVIAAIQIDGSYVVLDGLRVEEAGGGGIRISSGDHAKISNCLIYNNGWAVKGDSFGGAGILLGGKASDSRIENSESWQNREHGIYVSNGPKRVVVVGNRIHDNGDPNRNLGGNGIQVNADGPNYPSEEIIMERNTIYQNRSSGISAQGAQRSRIVNNLIYENKKYGIQFSKGSIDNFVAHNTVYTTGGLDAVNITSGGNHGPNTGNKFSNNILVALGSGGRVGLIYGETNPPAESDYNIFWTGSGKAVVTNETKKDKLKFSDWKTQGFDTHSLNMDPQFVNPEKRDFHLKSGSPALHAGSSLKDVTVDLENKPRSPEGLSDIGSFTGGY